MENNDAYTAVVNGTTTKADSLFEMGEVDLQKKWGKWGREQESKMMRLDRSLSTFEKDWQTRNPDQEVTREGLWKELERGYGETNQDIISQTQNDPKSLFYQGDDSSRSSYKNLTNKLYQDIDFWAKDKVPGAALNTMRGYYDQWKGMSTKEREYIDENQSTYLAPSLNYPNRGKIQEATYDPY